MLLISISANIGNGCKCYSITENIFVCRINKYVL